MHSLKCAEDSIESQFATFLRLRTSSLDWFRSVYLHTILGIHLMNTKLVLSAIAATLVLCACSSSQDSATPAATPAPAAPMASPPADTTATPAAPADSSSSGAMSAPAPATPPKP